MKLSRKTISVALIAAAFLWCAAVLAVGCLGRLAVGELRWYRFPVVPLACGVELVTYDGDFVCICITGSDNSRIDVAGNQIIFLTLPHELGYPPGRQGVYVYNAGTRKRERSDAISCRSDEERDAPAQIEVSGSERSRYELYLGASGDEWYGPLYRYFVKRVEALPSRRPE